MMELTINVPGLVELAAAISSLAGAAKQKDMPAAPEVSAARAQSVAPVSAVPTEAPTTPTAPMTPSVAQTLAVPVQSAAPMAPATTQAPTVPVATRNYTADELARAAMMLMDAGKQTELVQLLQSFGVDSLPALAPEQYGAFATALRGMGAQI